MITTERIKKHQDCIEILEAVRFYELLIKSKKESLDGFCGTFPKLRKEYIHDIKIYQMCIDRLMERYNKINTF